MDEGFLTDNKGNPVPFNKTIILLTSNIGVDEIDTIRNRMGFDTRPDSAIDPEDARDATLEAMRNAFRPEFINRLDGVVVFNNLTVKDCFQIARLQLDRVAGYLEHSGIQLTYTSQVARRIARLGFSPDYGARELRRFIQAEIEDPLSERILRAGYRSGDEVRVMVRAKQFCFEKRRRRTAPVTAPPKQKARRQDDEGLAPL
jgi:ATP-dependent Clp protease ATP-binding subunit ClpC